MSGMKINALAKLTGVTVRTLHYYDEIGLLTPSKVSDSGYRIYDEEDILKMQQIMFFRELEFPLSEIKTIISCPGFDEARALEKHCDLLRQKRLRLDRLIALAEKTIRGERDMNFDAFNTREIEKFKKEYADEVKKRWGNTEAFRESEAKTSHYGKADWERISGESDRIFKAFAENRNESPEKPEIQALVKTWQNFITENYYNCTKEILGGLGEMYTQDERFKNNIDKYGDGTAEFMKKAIRVYCGL